MKVLAVNGSPRKTKNTASMLKSMCKGAAASGAETELVHLCTLQYTGCVSCFKCKLVGSKSYGRCAVRDELTPVLQAAHEADVVILGSPIYFFCETALMRSFMERFLFQYLLYTSQKPPLSPRKKAIALVYTMNVKEQDITAYGMNHSIAATELFLKRIFGGSELFICSDTKQMDDYSKYEIDYFDTAAKDKRHAEVFPQELQRAFDFGSNLVKC
ncbi:MAG: flavodoxin family protein [Syntrophaceae bacterium]|nr:flavodoxin family protein [Syntrophaceae bacterium]